MSGGGKNRKIQVHFKSIRNILFLTIQVQFKSKFKCKAIFNNKINNSHHIVHIHEMVITAHAST